MLILSNSSLPRPLTLFRFLSVITRSKGIDYAQMLYRHNIRLFTDGHSAIIHILLRLVNTASTCSWVYGRAYFVIYTFSRQAAWRTRICASLGLRKKFKTLFIRDDIIGGLTVAREARFNIAIVYIQPSFWFTTLFDLSKQFLGLEGSISKWTLKKHLMNEPRY